MKSGTGSDQSVMCTKEQGSVDRDLLIAPSILSADLPEIRGQLGALEKGGADWVHIDVMDGNFVPNLTFGPMVIGQFRPLTDMPFDVHLMIDRPERYLDEFIRAGADLITIHPESTVHLQRALSRIGESGIRAGLALNPSTPLDTLDWILDDLDMLVIMSVNPGFGGQSFIPASIRKIRDARKILDSSGRHIHLQVDGGIADSNAGDVVRAGADVLVAGSFTFRANDGDIGKNIALLREAVRR